MLLSQQVESHRTNLDNSRVLLFIEIAVKALIIPSDFLDIGFSLKLIISDWISFEKCKINLTIFDKIYVDLVAIGQKLPAGKNQKNYGIRLRVLAVNKKLIYQ